MDLCINTPVYCNMYIEKKIIYFYYKNFLLIPLPSVGGY